MAGGGNEIKESEKRGGGRKTGDWTRACFFGWERMEGGKRGRGDHRRWCEMWNNISLYIYLCIYDSQTRRKEEQRDGRRE